VSLADQTGIGAVPFHRAKCSFGPEPFYAGNFSDDLRCRELAAAGQSQQWWNHVPDKSTNLMREVVGTLVQRTATRHQLAGDIRYRPRQRPETLVQYGQHRLVPQAFERDLEAGEKLVQMPTQAALQPSSFGDQVLSVIDEQA
jgi:hypothetical protein